MNTNLLIEMKKYAQINKVPILLDDSLNYIKEFIKEHKIKKVLEIGSAIAYSTINIGYNVDCITSIERDEIRYKEAISNINKSKLNNITLIFDDAFNTNIKEKFDLIFIDAAKGKNIEFIEYFKKNLNNNGYFIIDNVDFHGLVGKSNEIKSRNLRSLVRKIEAFHKYLDEQTEYIYNKINVGDGLILLQKAK